MAYTPWFIDNISNWISVILWNTVELVQSNTWVFRHFVQSDTYLGVLDYIISIDLYDK